MRLYIDHSDLVHEFGEEKFRDWYEYAVERIQERFPSFHTYGKDWLEYPYRETRVICENTFLKVTVSNYCGLTALCLLPQEDLEDTTYYGTNLKGLAERFTDNASKWFAENFGDLSLVATASNGEAFFERVGA